MEQEDILLAEPDLSKSEEIYMSEYIEHLATALAKCQGSLEGAKKDQNNPFFKSSYADLSSVWDACRKPLSSNGLSVVQLSMPCDTGLSLMTMMIHSSGQWIKSFLKMTPTKSDPQGCGSCLTYMRRYSLMALVGIAPEDDDAEGATDRKKEYVKQPKPKSEGFKSKTSSEDREMLAEMFGKEGYADGLEKLTENEKDGKFYKGIRSLADIKSEAQSKVIHGKIKDAHKEWQKTMEEAKKA